MGPSPSSELANASLQKSLDQLYSLAMEMCGLQCTLKSSPNHALFSEMMEIFQPYRTKYRWADDIPVMMRRHFYMVFDKLRDQQTQSFYRALNLTIFTKKQSSKDNQSFFYEAVSRSQCRMSQQSNFDINTVETQMIQQNDRNLNPSLMLEQSILFEDDVVFKFNQHKALTDNQSSRMEVSEIYRESVLNPQFNDQPNNFIVYETMFVENLPVESRQQIGFHIEFYRRFSMVLQSLINSAAFVSLPLRHFELQLRHDRMRKKIKAARKIQRQMSLDTIPKIYQENEEGEKKRKTVAFNQDLLLSMVSHFIQTYSQFVWCYYNLSKLQEVESARLIDSENIYNLLTDAVWNRVCWIGDRGSEYEELKVTLYLSKREKWPKQTIPISIIDLAANMPTSPMKHLKHIVKIYRQVITLSKQMTADILMLKYRRLLCELAGRKKITGLMRMIDIVNRLWKGQKFGEVGYAWTTWQAAVEIVNKEVQKISLLKMMKDGQMIVAEDKRKDRSPKERYSVGSLMPFQID